MLEVQCSCGRTISVTAGQAGSLVDCPCGRQVKVSSLRDLREAASSAGRSIEPPHLKHDWKAWWMGVGLFVTGEVLQLVGFGMLGISEKVTLTVLAGAAVFLLGYVCLFVGLLMVGLGKGFALWLCLLLIFCVPCGRLGILFIPGKGYEESKES